MLSPRILMCCHRAPGVVPLRRSRVLPLACCAQGHLPCRCAQYLAAIRQDSGAERGFPGWGQVLGVPARTPCGGKVGMVAHWRRSPWCCGPVN